MTDVGNLRQQLCRFRMHEETPVESILAHFSLEDVFEQIDSILKTAEPEAVAHALGFVRDANLFQHPYRDGFHKHLASSAIWETLQRLLRASNFSIRRNTIYTIGKLTSKDRAYLLSDVFTFYLENDPINLPNLLLELLWLTNRWNWNFVEQVASAKHYLKRWSLCQIFDDTSDSTETRRHFLEVLVRLECDLHPLIASEAKMRFERINVKLGQKLSKAEWRKEVNRISSLKPRLTFEHAATLFMHNRLDYALDDFDRFVCQLT